MSYYTNLLALFIFLLLYSDHVSFLATHMSPMVLWLGLEGSGFSYHGSSSLSGEYTVWLFLSEEPFMGTCVY
jgi:hypothetical protein